MHLSPIKFWVKVIVSICEIPLTAHHATAILSLVIVINSEYHLCYQHTIKILTSLTHRALPIWTNIIPTTTKRQSPFTRLLYYLPLLTCHLYIYLLSPAFRSYNKFNTRFHVAMMTNPFFFSFWIFFFSFLFASQLVLHGDYHKRLCLVTPATNDAA